MMRAMRCAGEAWRIAKLAKIWTAAARVRGAISGSQRGTRGRGEIPPRVKAAFSKGKLFACDGYGCGARAARGQSPHPHVPHYISGGALPMTFTP